MDPDATMIVSAVPDGTPPAVPAGAANPDAKVAYVFGNEIARGGMGSILEAQDCKIGRTVAVKIMRLEMGADEDQKQRFINEAAVLGTLEHPNIVPIHDLGRDADGHLFYTMKLVKGRTLQAILNDIRDEVPEAPKHYTLDRLLTIFRKVCDALAFAHSRGIIHRDLKPENVMVGEFGEVLVMDWGIAKQTRNAEGGTRNAEPGAAGERSALRVPSSDLGQTLAGTVMGTPQYMSPEQAQGSVAEMDALSDIFSLGGILYAVLTLRPPVEGTTVEEVLRKVGSGSITPPSAFGAGTDKGNPGPQGEVLEAKKIRPLPHCPGGRVPSALSAVAMKALTVQREQRYQDVAAFSADIEAYQTGFATSAENAGAWKQLTLLVKRHKAASIGVAAVLLVGGVLGTKAIIEGRRAAREAARAQHGEALAKSEAVRAERGEAEAKATLHELRRTAPTFAAQATGLVEQGDLTEALEKIGYAVSLDKGNANYLLQQANLLQATQQLTEAVASYRGVLALRADAAAKMNLELCEKLLRDNAGGPEIQWESQGKLLAALIKQGRTLEAVTLSSIVGKESETGRAAIQARLKPLAALAGSKLNVVLLPNGSFRISVIGKLVVELPPLNGLPITEVSIGETYGPSETSVTNLTPLKGLRLKRLHLVKTPVSDLSPLAGMPLESFSASATKISDLTPLKGMPLTELLLSINRGVSDLSPLRGMRLRNLKIDATSVSDLRPLAGMPIEELDISSTGVSDLSPLAGMRLTSLKAYQTKIANLSPLRSMPLRILDLPGVPVSDLSPLMGMPIEELNLWGTKVTDIGVLRTLPLKRLNIQCPVKDLSPLADCKGLEWLAIPKGAADISFLRALPNLQRLSDDALPRDWRNALPPAEQFWQKYDAQKAAEKK